MLRGDDRLIANELHPVDSRTLQDNLGDDPRIGVLQVDGYGLLKSQLPPPERRGLVLIDPPFEKRDEFDTLFRGMREALARWPTGMYAVWYPIKDMKPVEQFIGGLKSLGISKFLAAHFMMRPANDPELFKRVRPRARQSAVDDARIAARMGAMAGRGPAPWRGVLRNCRGRRRRRRLTIIRRGTAPAARRRGVR